MLEQLTQEQKSAAYAAMDEEAAQFWAYPDQEWQDNFLEDFANEVLKTS